MVVVPSCALALDSFRQRTGAGMVLGVVFALVACGGCSPSSMNADRSVPRSFGWLNDCLCRGTSHHDGTTLSPAEAHRLASNPFGVSLRKLRSLDAPAARELAACRGFLHFACLETLEPTAAAELARHGEDLRLDRLESLSADTARVLSQHTGALHLNGLRSIDLATAQALATHEGFLALNGLEGADEGVIETLSRHRGHLCINGVDSLSARAASAIMGREGHASLHGLSTLTYESLRIIVGGNGRPGIDLPEWIPTRFPAHKPSAEMTGPVDRSQPAIQPIGRSFPLALAASSLALAGK